VRMECVAYPVTSYIFSQNLTVISSPCALNLNNQRDLIVRQRPPLEPYTTRAVPIGAVLNLGTTTSQKCEAVPKRARV